MGVILPHPNHDYLYENKLYVTKWILKAKLDDGDQEGVAQNMCYKYLTSFRRAIDIGARYGGWSREMQIRFQHVYAFEPRSKWLKVYPLNIKMNNVSLFPFGLGDKEEQVTMVGNRIRPGKEVVDIKRLDDIKTLKVDFIKIDTDGYELNVLKGGIKTILKNKPIICMEVILGEPFHGELAEAYLIDLGAKKIDECGHNILFGW